MNEFTIINFFHRCHDDTEGGGSFVELSSPAHIFNYVA